MSTIDDRQLADLVDEPREALDVEVKEWLDLERKEHQATLAKEIMALSNHGGGFIVIGFREAENGFITAPNPPCDLSGWSQDRVQGVVERYLNPTVQCQVVHKPSSTTGQLHPIVVVPGGERVPVVAKKGSPDNSSLSPSRVYIRRPGPNSEEPRSPEDWNLLFDRILQNRRSELMDAFRSLLSGVLPTASPEPVSKTRSDQLDDFVADADNKWRELVAALPSASPARMPFGYYDMAFAIDGDFDKASLAELKNKLQASVRNHSGWPPFLTISRPPLTPYPVDGAVQAWMGAEDGGNFADAAHSDFWRVSPEGLMFTRRGYSEDGDNSPVVKGEGFDLDVPTWRLGEGILNASYIAASIGAGEADLICRARWTGLKGRKLFSHGRRYLSREYRCSQDEYSAEVRVAVSLVADVLPEIVHQMLFPLYELFDFFALPEKLVEKELSELTRNTFAI